MLKGSGMGSHLHICSYSLIIELLYQVTLICSKTEAGMTAKFRVEKEGKREEGRGGWMMKIAC